jgi:hypothetical protein
MPSTGTHTDRQTHTKHTHGTFGLGLACNGLCVCVVLVCACRFNHTPFMMATWFGKLDAAREIFDKVRDS